MPTATSFTALGKGNGFSSCLELFNPIEGSILLNEPSLKETMKSYWNFNKVSYGGATFESDNQPKDLICNPNANVGFDEDGNADPNQSGAYRVRNQLPSIFFIDDVKYYKHGISMNFEATNSTDLFEGGQSSSIFVDYFSSLYVVDSALSGYECVDETFGPPPDPEVIGKSASERTQDISKVTISGIPFIKQVTKTFGGSFFGTLICPTPNYPSIPDDPTLDFYTY